MSQTPIKREEIVHFTLEKALAIQSKQLEEWESLLKENVYKDLLAWVEKKNEGITNPYDIIRGNGLLFFIQNYYNNREWLMRDVGLE